MPFDLAEQNAVGQASIRGSGVVRKGGASDSLVKLSELLSPELSFHHYQYRSDQLLWLPLSSSFKSVSAIQL
jgi:hypothetical protein